MHGGAQRASGMFLAPKQCSILCHNFSEQVHGWLAAVRSLFVTQTGYVNWLRARGEKGIKLGLKFRSARFQDDFLPTPANACNAFCLCAG